MSMVAFNRSAFSCFLEDETESLGLQARWPTWLHGWDFHKIILTTPTIDSSVVIHLPPCDVVGILADRPANDRSLRKSHLRAEQSSGQCTA